MKLCKVLVFSIAILFISDTGYGQDQPEIQSQTPVFETQFGKGITYTNAASTLNFKIGARVQTLFTSSRSLSSDSEWESNLLIRRARLKAKGYVFTPKLKFKIELAFSDRDRSLKKYDEVNAPPILLDAVLQYKVNNNLEIWFGQTKLPGNRERVVSSQKLQFVDRSLVNSTLNIDRDFGVHFRGKFKTGKMLIKPIFAIAQGEGRSVIGNNIGGLSYTGRLEFLPFGDFSKGGDYFGSDLKRESKPKLALGISYNVNMGTSRQKQSGKFLLAREGGYLQKDIDALFIDGMFKYQGFSLTGEYGKKSFMDINYVPDGFPPSEFLDDSGKSFYTGNGFNIQGGYLLKKNWEIAGRYTSISPDHKLGFQGAKEYTVGMSKYINDHKLKIQSDVSLSDKSGVADHTLRYRLQFEVVL